MEFHARAPVATARPRSSVVSRIRERWLLALFSLPFAGVGIGMLCLSVAPNLIDAQRMQSWYQGEADLISASLDVNHGDGSTTYRARATYAYRYGGRDYTGSRVSIGSSSDNIGDFQQRLGRRLEQARSNHQTVPVWINPDDPHQAVLNRDLRWGKVAFSMVFVLVFGGAGVGLLVFALYNPGDRIERADAGEEPWLTRRYWASATVKSNARSSMRLGWGFAGLWNAIAIPVGVMVTLDYLEKGNAMALVGLLFPVAGVGLLLWAVAATLEWRRFGRAALALDPYPGAIGGQVGGTIDVRLRYDSKLMFKTTLSCLRSYVSGTGKNRRRTESLVWQSEGFAHTHDHYGNTRLEILFDVDADLPASDAKDAGAYHLWRLQVEAEMPGTDFDRSYEIPVFPTGEHARELRQLCVEHSQAAEYRMRSIEQVLNVRQVPGGVELYYPAFRQVVGKTLGILFGAVFVGAGLLAGRTGAPMVFPVVFGAIGGLIALAAAWSLLTSLEVRLDRQWLQTRKRLLGFVVGGSRVPRGDIRRLELKQSYSTSSGQKHTVYYKLQARTVAGKAVDVGYNLKGQDTAREALEALGGLTGIPCS